MMTSLADQRCRACPAGTPPLKSEEIRPLLEQLNGWSVIESHHLEKTYRFEDFGQALAFVNKIGAIAESENHHPDIALAWGRVGLTIWTHTVGGLRDSDFILAAKADQAFTD